MPDYPPEWLAAVTRALSAIDRVPSELPAKQMQQLSDAHLILDHVVPVIQRTTVEQVNHALALAGVKRQVRQEITGAVTVDAWPQQPTELIDVRGLETQETVDRRLQNFVDVADGVKADINRAVHTETTNLLEQLIARCDRVLEVSSDIRRVEAAGVLGEILEDVRQERKQT